MKKILFGILTIFGIGLSFCSAEDIFTDFSSYSLYNSSFSSFADCSIRVPPNNSNYNSCFSYKSLDNTQIINFTGSFDYFYINSFCIGYIQNSSPKFVINGVSYTTGFYTSGFNICYDFSNPLLISSSSPSFSFSFQYYWGGSNQNTFSNYYLSKGSSCRSYYYSNTSYVLTDSVYYYKLSDSIYMYYDYSLLNGTYFSCYDYNGIPILGSISISVPDIPKFKVNYGNTSYEYELTDNLEIHLKSPVVMSGTTDYIYNGSTGINLFYNGSSQRYNKSELYLNTPSWYNNNIFTPICL